MNVFGMRAVRKDVKELAEGSRFYNGKINSKIDVRLMRMLSNSILRSQAKGEDMLYYSGKLIGCEFGRNNKTDNMDGVITAIDDTLRKMGIGYIRDSTKKDSMIIINVQECPLCDPGKDSRCYFSAGLMAGIASEALSRNVVGKEVDCKDRDSNICTFELRFI